MFNILIIDGDIIHCKEDEKIYYRALLVLNACLNCLISASLIYWRLELRPNVKFWSKEAWRSMNLFFLWFILYYYESVISEFAISFVPTDKIILNKYKFHFQYVLWQVLLYY